MSKFKPVPPELVRRFAAALPADADVERRQMFGCPWVFVNGNMAAGLHEDRLIVRAPQLAAERPCVIGGRTMKQYAAFDDALSLAGADLTRRIAQGLAYTRGLPAKARKARARRQA